MPSTSSLSNPPLRVIRAQVRLLREARANRQALRRDLETYTSDSDLNDLGAILDRYDDDETRDIRQILAAKRYH
jgi:hypothetical protein